MKRTGFVRRKNTVYRNLYNGLILMPFKGQATKHMMNFKKIIILHIATNIFPALQIVVPTHPMLYFVK